MTAGPRRLGLLLIASSILAFGSLIASSVTPLASAHFDSPIYLYQSMRFVDTELLDSFRRHAPEIAQQVREHSWPATEGYSEAFWRFMRLGHIAQLGFTTSFIDDPMSTLRVAGLANGFLLALAVASAFLLVAALCELQGIGFAQRHAIAAGLSALAYCLSPIFSYLAGNLLSEVPALLALTLGLLCLTHALLRHSTALAVLAGIALFAVYAVRVDSLWTAMVCSGAIALAALWRPGRQHLWRPLLVVFSSALAAFAAYSALFHPLTDPRLIAELRQVLIQNRAAVLPAYQAAPVAGGLLWIGAVAALVNPRERALSALGLCILPLLLLPRLNGLLAGTLHSRAVTELLLPLMLLSTAGLAGMFGTQGRRRRAWLTVAGVGVAMTVGAIAIVPATYQWVYATPGLWRIQTVKNLLVPAKYERNRYDTYALRDVAAAIYADGSPAVLLRDAAIPQEHLNLVRFFGPRYPHDADLALTPDITNPRVCSGADLMAHRTGEPVLYCTDHDATLLTQADALHYRLLQLSMRNAVAPPPDPHYSRRIVLQTDDFELAELAGQPSR